MKEKAIQTRLYREKLLADPYRPGYHFAIPDGNGVPGDSNGAFYADGRYHLMYLYWNETTQAYHWGHTSSIDLLHWRNHPDCLTLENGDKGCFSGGAFVDDDGTAYLTFWKFASKDFAADNGGIDIAFSKPPYDVWERIRPIAIEGSKEVWGTKDIVIDGEIQHISCADPSNIWKQNGVYYMQTGNLCVLNEYGRKEDSPEKYKGGWTDLFRSEDLKNWTYVHRFYVDPNRGVDDWPDETEDDMCPSFLPLPDRKSGGRLTDKWLQCFISHNKGAQYYIGELKDEKFYPEQHGRLSWVDDTYFAPEALIDHKNRQISWSWLRDNMEGDYEKYGWTGVFSFPRTFWIENNELRMAPPEELDNLQFNGQTFETGEVKGQQAIAVKNPESFRIRAEIDMKNASRAGFIVRADEANGQHVKIYVDRAEGKLIMDTSSLSAGRAVREEAPFILKEGEKLSIDIFVDKSVIEVYANERQSICRRAFHDHPELATAVKAISDGADFAAVSCWEMFPTNPY